MFELDKKLQQDTFFVYNFEFSKLLLMNNANYPWLILVPQASDLVDFDDLEFNQQLMLVREINFASEILREKFFPDKINVGMLGNMVRQFHVHVIARFKEDKAFPRPVWGEESEIYDDLRAQKLINEIREICKDKNW